MYSQFVPVLILLVSGLERNGEEAAVIFVQISPLETLRSEFKGWARHLLVRGIFCAFSDVIKVGHPSKSSYMSYIFYVNEVVRIFLGSPGGAHSHVKVLFSSLLVPRTLHADLSLSTREIV